VSTVSVAVSRAAIPNGESNYARANARLARTVKHYPRARLLVEEPVNGEVGTVPFQAVERIYSLSPASTQRLVNRFFERSLGKGWRHRSATCFVSRSRLVVAVVSTRRRRLGVLIDSRGAPRCYDLTGQIGDLLDLGYPQP